MRTGLEGLMICLLAAGSALMPPVAGTGRAETVTASSVVGSGAANRFAQPLSEADIILSSLADGRINVSTGTAGAATDSEDDRAGLSCIVSPGGAPPTCQMMFAQSYWGVRYRDFTGKHLSRTEFCWRGACARSEIILLDIPMTAMQAAARQGMRVSITAVSGDGAEVDYGVGDVSTLLTVVQRNVDAGRRS
jgi:hypothetical protein